MYSPKADSYPMTTAATERRPSRPSGKSCINVRMDEWLFDWVKAEVLKGKRSLSLQVKMIVARYAEGKIK